MCVVSLLMLFLLYLATICHGFYIPGMAPVNYCNFASDSCKVRFFSFIINAGCKRQCVHFYKVRLTNLFERKIALKKKQ